MLHVSQSSNQYDRKLLAMFRPRIALPSTVRLQRPNETIPSWPQNPEAGPSRKVASYAG